MPLAKHTPTYSPTRSAEYLSVDMSKGIVACVYENSAGDFILRDSKALTYFTTTKEYYAQLLVFHIRTERGTMPLFPELGCRIRSDLIGKQIDNINVLNTAQDHLNQDLDSLGFNLARPAEVLPYDHETIIININVLLPTGLPLEQSYRMNVLEGTIEQLDGRLM